MAKDVPVLKISEGTCSILNYELLPFSLRKDPVTYEDFWGNWMSTRALQVSRTNGKMILNSLRLSQGNAYAICRACHGLSLTDMYWLKEEGEELSWKDINLFQNQISRGMAATALAGEVLHENGKIHTPELTTQGMAAKAWVRTNGNLFLYKIGRRELAASAILDALRFSHVHYSKAAEEELDRVIAPERKERVRAMGEAVVKCRAITSEKYSIVTFEDYQLYCEYQNKNVYDETLAFDRQHYLEMQVADYILNNVDRHGANWGFYMDNDSGKITGLHPLFDHDQAFSAVQGMESQTTEERMSLETAALLAQTELHADLGVLLSMQRPEGLAADEWEQVQKRTEALIDHVRIYENI